MMSLLSKYRLSYQPPIPEQLCDLHRAVFREIKERPAVSNALRALFPKTRDLPAFRVEKGTGPKRPLRAGVLFSGGQAAGGHNVISGLFDGLNEIHPESRLIGFLNGPAGLIANESKELTKDLVDAVRNQGGFDLIGSGRTKIETPEQLMAAAKSAKENRLDAIIVIGGDDSNTNAAILAEYFLENSIKTRVIGVPKTIDGDLRSPDIEISFGFDSACKTYAELIGNIARDALSAKKYYHFIKLMGRSASHIALECALATCPNLALIGEEKQSLKEIVADIVSLISERKEKGKEYGIVLIPEGLIEFIPEFKSLIESCNALLARETEPQKVVSQLSVNDRDFFLSLPEKIREQLLLERDPHGNVQISQIETDVLVMTLVKNEIKRLGGKISAQPHFFGYEGRACFPSNFDANYCYALGRLGALAVRDEATGVILALRHLGRPVAEWEPKAVPIVQLMDLEMRGGKEKPVIAKTLVDLNGKPFRRFERERKQWRTGDFYQTPGPMQFYGDSELTDSIPISLAL